MYCGLEISDFCLLRCTLCRLQLWSLLPGHPCHLLLGPHGLSSAGGQRGGSLLVSMAVSLPEIKQGGHRGCPARRAQNTVSTQVLTWTRTTSMDGPFGKISQLLLFNATPTKQCPQLLPMPSACESSLGESYNNLNNEVRAMNRHTSK